MSGSVSSSITTNMTTAAASATGVIVVAAGLAWGIKALWVAWRAGSKATNKVGT